MRIRLVALALASCALLAACAHSSNEPADSKAADAAYDPQALPTGPVGEAIARGRAIVVDTVHQMPKNVRVRMNCAACHLGGGTIPRGGSFVGTYSQFPQWNKRSHRVIALQDRLAECFLYSMNGTPPAFQSKEMIALVAYISWLSRGTSVLAPPPASSRFIVPLPTSPPDVARGATLYAQKCTSCHRASGDGIGSSVPPLWGNGSFNAGAGMAHIDRMTGFVMYNMPQNAPGSLSLRDAYDVSAFVLSHKRPAFDQNRTIQFTAQSAKYY